jgi:enoyl reductase
MSSVRVRGIGTRIVAPSMLLAALAGGLVAGPATGPALASGSRLDAGAGQGGVQPPGPGGGGSSNGDTYISDIGGNYTGGGGTPWTPPPCWVQPFFPQTDTWQAGDPSSQITDADSYYSWFVGQGAPAAESAAQMASEFQEIQQRKAPAGWTGPKPIKADDVWWAPNWVNSSTGYACAEGLAAEDDLSNQYIGLEPPLQAGQQSPLTGAINAWDLSQIALAKITLPKISIVTSPPGTQARSAVVNTPTYVAVKYRGHMDPSKTESASFIGLATIWASVQATVTSVTVSASPASGVSSTTGFGVPGQTCAAVNGEATSACSVTFGAPSGTTPDNLQVTVTWKVTWSNSDGVGGSLTPGSRSYSKTVTVDEIQSQT